MFLLHNFFVSTDSNDVLVELISLNSIYINKQLEKIWKNYFYNSQYLSQGIYFDYFKYPKNFIP